MNSKTITIIVIAIIIGLGAVLFIATDKSEAPETEATRPQDSSQTQQSTQPEEIETEATKTYTMAEVQSHKTATDCWTVINGSVYNITSYVPRHPGGDEILRACGADGTTMFESRETTSGEEIGSGTPHSSNAEQQLAQLKIGTLAQ